MSETVKLVIEIPSEVYEHIKGHTDNWIDFMFLSRDGKAISAVKYGTPLSEVLAEIKAEIEKLDEGITSYHNDKPWVYKSEVLEILDNIGNEKSPRT